MIQKFKSYARVAEVNSVATSLIHLYNEKTWENEIHLKSVFTGLTAESTDLTQAINRSKSESVLSELDSECDKWVDSLYYLGLGASHHPDVAIRTSTEQLNDVFGKYGLKITRESYEVENSLILALLKDLEKTELKEHIAAIPGYAEAIALLDKAQQKFKTAYVDWEQEKNKEEKIRSASEIKKSIVEIINDKIVPYLNAMSQIAPAAYADFANDVARIIETRNDLIKSRNKKPEPVS